MEILRLDLIFTMRDIYNSNEDPLIKFKSSDRTCSVKKDVLKISQILQSTCVGISFSPFNKVAGLRAKHRV